MSLILEALRKSEAERRRGLAPDVAMELPPTPASRPRSVAAWLLPALVVAVLLVLAAWWLRREPAKSASTDIASTANGANPETVPAAIREISPAEIPPEMPRIEPKPAAVASVQAPDMATPAAAAVQPPMPTRASPASPAPAGAPARPAPRQPAPVQALPARPLPTPEGEVGNDTSMLPPTKLSMLMWDDVPAKRFVILNGQRMAEGDRYGGITVVSIERNGVVVEGNGTRARVPLP
jgi:general secretion pathway protein B